MKMGRAERREHDIMKEELEFFQAWWKILRKYWNPPGRHDHGKAATEFWDGLVSECRILPENYKENELFYPFASKMSLALVHEISRRADELRKGAKKQRGNEK